MSARGNGGRFNYPLDAIETAQDAYVNVVIYAGAYHNLMQLTRDNTDWRISYEVTGRQGEWTSSPPPDEIPNP